MLLQDLRAVSVCPDGSDTRTALNFTQCSTTGQCLSCENGFLVLMDAPFFFLSSAYSQNARLGSPRFRLFANVSFDYPAADCNYNA